MHCIPSASLRLGVCTKPRFKSLSHQDRAHILIMIIKTSRLPSYSIPLLLLLTSLLHFTIYNNAILNSIASWSNQILRVEWENRSKRSGLPCSLKWLLIGKRGKLHMHTCHTLACVLSCSILDPSNYKQTPQGIQTLLIILKIHTTPQTWQ